MSKRIDIEGIGIRIRNMLCGDLILSHHLIGSSPAARPYLQDCAEGYAELEEISNQVEMGLCTSAWLMGRDT
jgi:hypothetical protein